MKKIPAKRRPVLLTNVPDDIMGLLIETQGKLRMKYRGQISLETVIYKFIRANKDLSIE